MLNTARMDIAGERGTGGLGVSLPGEDAASSVIDSVSDWWRLRKEGEMQAEQIAATRERLVVLVDQQDKASQLERERLSYDLIGNDNRVRARTGLIWAGGALALVTLAVLT